MGITKRLARELSEIKITTERDIKQLHNLILDFTAAAVAGYVQNKTFNRLVEAIVLSQGGAEESAVMFQKKKYPARVAAFMNSVYGHGAELDDGNKKAAGHCGVHIIPAVFALAEKNNCTNEDVLNALATGYEAFIRISSAVQPGIIKRGFHPTGMAGTIASAAACAKLSKLDAKGIENAMALATTMTGGLLSYGESRQEIKPLNPGKAAENGVFAAMLAAQGVQGPLEALEGRHGWFNATTDAVDEKQLMGTDHLLLHDCYFKLYPSCRHTHCGIDAAREIYKQTKAENIKEIKVHIYPNAIRLAGIKMPANKDETKFSIHYTIARTLLTGNYGLSDMRIDNLTAETAELIKRINLISDDSMEDRKKGIRGARVEVVENNGSIIEKTVLVPKGDPENPITHEDIEKKFKECAFGVVSESDQEALIKQIDEITSDCKFYNPLHMMPSRQH